MAFGFGTEPYTTEDFTTRGSEPQDMVAVHLPDGVYVLTKAAFDDVVESARDAASFEDGVRRVHIGKKDEWTRERGPDSPLGRGMEAGQAPVDHGGAPPPEEA